MKGVRILDKRVFNVGILVFAILVLLGVGITFAYTVARQPPDIRPRANGEEASHFINPQHLIVTG